MSPVFALVGFVGLCLLVGLTGGTLTARSVHTWYAALVAPPLTPPNWVFPVAWTLLYVSLGVSGWMAWLRPGSQRALLLWGWQLGANAMWVPAFFGLHRPGLALAVMAAVLALTVLTIRAFLRVRRAAGLLLVPYLAWCGFAAYLNLGFLLLNWR